MIGRLITSLILIAASANTATAANERDLEQWLDREAVPFVRTALLEHPRFKGETVMFVVLDKNSTTTTSNDLALSLRDRLLDAAVDTPGVTIAWRQGRSNAHHGTEAIDCTRDDVDYFIGVELSQQLDESYSVSLRALDVQERNWVSGFGHSWRGHLSMTQRRAFRQDRVDETFLGARDVPFTADQNDLLARYLAHELSCALLRETSGEYIIPADLSAESGTSRDNTIELVSNNVAANAAIQLTSDARKANAEISGKAHRIDDDLFQYWLTVTPKGENSELSSLKVSAYVLKRDSKHANTNPARSEQPGSHREYTLPVRMTVAMPIGQRGSLIGPSSFADDAVVFFIQNQPHFGLVRLDSGVCRDRTMATVVRAGDPFQIPVEYAHSLNSKTIDTENWYVTPLRDTYYAIAISDEGVARQIANHLDQLPIRCGASTRRGLSGQALHQWLDELAALAAGSAQQIDWRAVEIKDFL